MREAFAGVWQVAQDHKVSLRTATFIVACKRILHARNAGSTPEPREPRSLQWLFQPGNIWQAAPDAIVKQLLKLLGRCLTPDGSLRQLSVVHATGLVGKPGPNVL